MTPPARKPYPSDLSDEAWARVEPLLPSRGSLGRPSDASDREVLDALLYRWHTGVTWRYLPHDFPNWPTVCIRVRHWRNAGVFPPIRAELLDRGTVLEAIRRGHAEAAHAEDDDAVEPGDPRP